MDFLDDALGSILALADATRTVQTEYTYAPFGGMTTQGTGSANSFQFTGRENDGDGLYFYRARYFDPTHSRFISQDPIGVMGGVNFYRFVNDDPVQAIDPLGLSDIVITVTRTGTTATSTSGTITVTVNGQGRFTGYSLEPPPNGTPHSIPTGEYPVELYLSPHFNMEVLLLDNVPGRNLIEIHPGNFPGDTRGCILPGTSAARNSVGGSRAAFNDIVHIVNQTVRSDIANKQPTSIEVIVQ